jgi:3-deoxy-manno-octulosonate cytidylyltransferase (CMP-KDO synthetase)
MTATVVIPARFGSTRFPAKILASSTGRPLVQHVVDQVRKCRRVREVIVATDDRRIVDALAPFQTRCVMTAETHQSGTDRVAEVAQSLDDEVIVNVQGDEPEIEPEIVDRLIDRMYAGQSQMGTVATPLPAHADPRDPNLVKVVGDVNGQAIYFSRSPVPFPRDGQSVAYLLHLGIYAYRRSFLPIFTGWEQTPLEKLEKLEQLRVVEHGVKIELVQVERAVHGIDTAEQYEAFVRRYQQAQSK